MHIDAQARNEIDGNRDFRLTMQTCVAARRLPVQVDMNQVPKRACNERPNDRGLGVQVAWNPQSEVSVTGTHRRRAMLTMANVPTRWPSANTEDSVVASSQFGVRFY